MKASRQALVIVGAAMLLGSSAVAARQKLRFQQRLAKDTKRWHTITVNRDITDIKMDGEEFQQLNELGNTVELRIEPAPGGSNVKRTEIAVKLKDTLPEGQTSAEALRRLRAALRNTQWRLETGEVLSADKPSSTKPTLSGKPIDYATRHAREGGRL